LVQGYGTGFSMTVVNDRYDIGGIADSIVFNNGLECEATDIIYVRETVSKQFLEDLSKELKDRKTLSASEKNIVFIYNELLRRGRTRLIKKEALADVFPLMIPLTRYEPTIEYPGPIVGIRVYSDIKDLSKLINFDLKTNEIDRNLVTSVFCDSDEFFNHMKRISRSYHLRKNIPTHKLDLMKPHQGIYLIRELMEASVIEE
jgi:hypothetical protein